MGDGYKKIVFVILLCLWAVPAQAEWQKLEEGFEYQALEGGMVHLVRIDPGHFRFNLLTARDYDQPALTASDYAQKSKSLLAINGGFFDPSFRSLGLLVRGGKEINPIRRNNWGIFLLKKNSDQRPSIIHQKAWDGKDVLLALEAGPRLIVSGDTLTFRESGPERRSAVGISSEGLVVIAMSEKLLQLSAWADLLKPYCRDALNLDGGGSSQLAMQHPRKQIRIDGWTPVPNALVVATPQ